MAKGVVTVMSNILAMTQHRTTNDARNLKEYNQKFIEGWGGSSTHHVCKWYVELEKKISDIVVKNESILIKSFYKLKPIHFFFFYGLLFCQLKIPDSIYPH